MDDIKILRQQQQQQQQIEKWENIRRKKDKNMKEEQKPKVETGRDYIFFLI